MLTGLQWHIHPDRLGELPGPYARGKNDRLGLDRTLFGLRSDDRSSLDEEPLDGDAFDNPCTAGPRPLGERESRVDRRCLAVVRYVQRTDEIVRPQKRPHFLGPVQIDDLGLDVACGCHRRTAEDLFPSFLIRCDRYRARRAVPRRLPGFGLERFEQPCGVGGQSGEAVCCFELGDKAGGVPRGSACEGALFDDRHIGDPSLCQVVGDATSDDAAPDDQNLGAPRQAPLVDSLVAGVVGSDRRSLSC